MLTLAQFATEVRQELELPDDLPFTAGSALVDDLGLDSFALLHLLVVVEDLAGACFDGPAIDLQVPWTVGDAYALYQSLAPA